MCLFLNRVLPQFWNPLSVNFTFYPHTLIATKPTFSYKFSHEPQMYDLKIGVSCEASVNFQHMSQKAAPATEFARCPTWRSPDNAIRKKHTTRHVLKCCACHAKWIWTRPKCCTCHEKWKSSSENDAKYCPCKIKHRSTCYETCWTATKCHACHAKRGYATFEPPKVTTLAELTI